MEREIKFRAWSDNSNKMLEWSTLVSNGACVTALFSSDTWHIMQYTGLKDNNGKDIYEGDIFLFDMSPKVPVEIKIEDGAICYWSMFHYGHTGEVKGNKFENPELLK